MLMRQHTQLYNKHYSHVKLSFARAISTDAVCLAFFFFPFGYVFLGTLHMIIMYKRSHITGTGQVTFLYFLFRNTIIQLHKDSVALHIALHIHTRLYIYVDRPYTDLRPGSIYIELRVSYHYLWINGPASQNHNIIICVVQQFICL